MISMTGPAMDALKRLGPGNIPIKPLAIAAIFQCIRIVTTGINTESVENGIVASGTQTRAGGYALTKAISRITTVGTIGDAVTLPALAPGQSAVIYNDGANAAKVFPNGASDAIDGGSAGASVTLSAGKRARFTCMAANVISSDQLGAASA